MIEKYLEILGEYFITPKALILSLGLLAIIIFYLKKPEPQEQLMPSIKFFMKDKADGKLNSILQRLKNNIFLLLHILIFTSIVLAVAQPFQWQQGDQNHRIHVLDNSANSQNQLQQHKNHLINNLGETNTIITASDNELLAEKVDAGEAENIIQNQKTRYKQPKTLEAIRTAKEFDGEIIIGSTLGGENYRQINQELASLNQEYKIGETGFQNKRGITQIKRINQEEFRLTVRNYMDQEQEMELRHSGQKYPLTISGQSTEKIDLNMEQGTNSIELEEDSFQLDNNAYIEYDPKERKAAVNVENNLNYIKTALNVQNTIQNVEEFEDQVPEGTDLIVTNEKQEVNNTPQIVYKPEKSYFGSIKTSEVSIKGENPINLGTVDYKEVSREVEGLSQPKDFLYKEQTDSETTYLNYESNRLENRPVYPLVWKKAIDSLIETSKPYYKSSKTGLKPGVKDGKHVNLLLELNPFERALEKSEYNEIEEIKRSYQKELTAISLILVLLEIIALRMRGVI